MCQPCSDLQRPRAYAVVASAVVACTAGSAAAVHHIHSVAVAAAVDSTCFVGQCLTASAAGMVSSLWRRACAAAGAAGY